MAKRLHTELLGPALGGKFGWTQSRMVDLADGGTAGGAQLEEKAIGRIVAGRGNPQSRTRLRMIPISAEILGLSRESIIREIYWRETYDRLSEEIKNGGTPVTLEGFVLLLRELPEGDDAGSAWSHAMAPFMEADLQWDAMNTEAMLSLAGRTKQQVRQSCALTFKRAQDRFAEFARKVRAGFFKLAARPAALIAARADSMRAVAAEQLFNLALLNDEHGWRLACDEAGSPLTTQWAAALLPSETEVAEFSSSLCGFLTGRGWQRRIANNRAVLTLAIASAAVDGFAPESKLQSMARLKQIVGDAVAELLQPCDGDRVPIQELPTYRRLRLAGIVPERRASLSVLARAAGSTAILIVAACLAYAGISSTVTVQTESVVAHNSQMGHPSDAIRVLRIAGPGGTRPTRTAAAGPGGTVATRMQV